MDASITTICHLVLSSVESEKCSTDSHIQFVMLSSHIFLGLPVCSLPFYCVQSLMLSSHIFLGLPVCSLPFYCVQSLMLSSHIFLGLPVCSLPFYCVQSLMLSSHILSGLPRLLFHSTVLCNNSLETCTNMDDSILFFYSMLDWLIGTSHVIDGLPDIYVCCVLMYTIIKIHRRPFISNASRLPSVSAFRLQFSHPYTGI